jgi:predicted ATPase
VDDQENEMPGFYNGYGGKSLHAQSHGESFLSLVLNRFRGNGLYLLDEPEAALSPIRQMTLLAHIDTLVKERSQFIIATHSPMLMAYPGAEILVFEEDCLKTVPYRETEHYLITRQFLNNPEKMLKELMED